MEIEGIIIRETAMAVLIDVGDGEEVWIPKSQIQDEQDSDEDGLTVLTIPEWLALDKGLI